MKTDFTQCYAKFSANNSEGAALRQQWGWNGTVVGVSHNSTTQISREGCMHLCGRGMDSYPWRDASNTLTTWILPVVGTLLQAPFESNATKRTFLAITRWVGSPIASLSYVLWNIKVSGKAALMLDMSVPYDKLPEDKSDFAGMRDSMYLLLVMNQYTMRPSAVLSGKEAEGLLRIVLFSRDLKLTDTDKTLRQMRRILAREIREMRRRGAVPVFVSTMWFLFAFALSIQAAFGALGQNATAHDLALGCLLAWFPILILGSIVDRNPIAAEAIRKKLNSLVDHVRHALRSETHRNEFIESFCDLPEHDQLKKWVHDVSENASQMHDFFIDFAGQARIRWHYGAAHPILSDIETCYIADKGRNWLADEREARANLVLGPVNDEGLIWFDIREFWQVFSAVAIVAGSCGGAFVLSFFTPTVGLGCRSGGYTIFFCFSLGLLIVEMTVWLALSPYEMEAKWLARTTTRLHSIPTVVRWGDDVNDRWRGVKRLMADFWAKIKDMFTKAVITLVLLLPWKDKPAMREKVEDKLDTFSRHLDAMSPHRKWDLFFFRPVEIFNSIWLVYIVLAQTFGWYKTCACVTSTWGGAGGYLDFSTQDTSSSRWVLYYWTTGTVMTGLVLAISMFYMTVEWCMQSFLSTEDYPAAMRGLRRTRKYRVYTFWFRVVWRAISRFLITPLGKVALGIGFIKAEQKTLLWTQRHVWNAKSGVEHEGPSPASSTGELPSYDPRTPLVIPAAGTRRSPSPRSEEQGHGYEPDTPALPHSLFPPALMTSPVASWGRRPIRRSEDIELLSPHARQSSESQRPLLVPQASSARSPSPSRTSNEHNPTHYTHNTTHDAHSTLSPTNYPTGLASPIQLEVSGYMPSGWSALDMSSIGARGVQSRTGYRRAMSDAGGSPPMSRPVVRREVGGAEGAGRVVIESAVAGMVGGEVGRSGLDGGAGAGAEGEGVEEGSEMAGLGIQFSGERGPANQSGVGNGEV